MRAVLSKVTEVAIRARASPWAALVLKGIGVACAITLLAWIGRSAAAGTAPVADAGAPVAIASAAPAPVIVGATGPVAANATGPPQLESADAGAIIQPGASVARGRATPDDPVYLNQATADELRRLPGVGAKRAQAIVALRARLGRFGRVEDLLRVKGVGRHTLRKWRPLLRLDAAPKAAADASN